MDELSLLAATLAGGAGAGVNQLASSTVTDLYSQMKRLLQSRLARSEGAADALAGADSASPEELRGRLEPHEAALVRDEQLQHVARLLFERLLDEGLLPESRAFSEQIRLSMDQLGKRVDELTREQYRVIAMLRLERQVLISGAAGSGKTLVAAEKSTRLANSGMRVLFLCHNPLLAQHVRRLVAGSPVEVQDFTSWVRQSGNDDQDSAYMPYYEPTEAELLAAIDRLLQEPKYDAVIVDEGQDFRGEWWLPVDAALRGIRQGILYIFYDAAQVLVARNDAFPLDGPLLDLTRNCRNSGAVLHMMSVLHSGLPDPDPVLAQFGGVLCMRWNQPEVPALVRSALSYLADEEVNNKVLLTGDRLSIDDVERLNGTVLESWQTVVVREIRKIHEAFPEQRTDGFRPWWELAEFSNHPTPQPADVRQLLRVMKRVQEALGLPDRDSEVLRPLTRLYERLARTGSLAPPRLVPRESGHWSDQDVPVYSISEFKGLEADGVVVLDHDSRQLTQTELFVGTSRARSHLVLVLRDETFRRHNVVDALGRWGGRR